MFLLLGCVDNVATVVMCCQNRCTAASVLSLSTLGADLGICIALMVAGGSSDAAIPDQTVSTVLLLLGFTAIASVSYAAAMVSKIAGSRLQWTITLIRAGLSLAIVILLTRTPYPESAATVAFGAVTIFGAVAEPCRTPASD